MKVGVNRGPSTLTRLAEGSPTSPCEGEGLARAWPIPTKMEHTRGGPRGVFTQSGDPAAHPLTGSGEALWEWLGADKSAPPRRQAKPA